MLRRDNGSRYCGHRVLMKRPARRYLATLQSRRSPRARIFGSFSLERFIMHVVLYLLAIQGRQDVLRGLPGT